MIDPVNRAPLSVAEGVMAGAPAPDRPPIESTGQELLDIKNAGALQMGFWVPNRAFATAKYLTPLRQSVAALRKSSGIIPLAPAVAEFKDWITSHSVYRMWVNSMIDEANAFVSLLPGPVKTWIKDHEGDNIYADDYLQFFETLSLIIQTSPSFNKTVQVGTPLNGYLAIPMGTRSGSALFHDAEFNSQFKKVLDAWNGFLKSSASLDKLDINDRNKSGSWISDDAIKANVWLDMEGDPSKPAYGFDSWNSFFIRNFLPGKRPFQGDASQVVNLGCESTPWAYVNGAILEQDFWVKDVQYSLLDLFGGRVETAELFSMGQVYQGFLSATHFHRWQAPVDGQLIDAWVEPGTYFAQRPSQGEGVGTWEGTESQPYLGHVATRAIFLFLHPTCGYVAMICIGMVEVSTCVIAEPYQMKPNEPPINIKRSTEIGHFEFGGSTHILLFQKDKVKLADWAINASQHHNDNMPQRLGSVVATAL